MPENTAISNAGDMRTEMAARQKYIIPVLATLLNVKEKPIASMVQS